MKRSTKYTLHRTIAIVVVPLLLLSTFTGFFRANQKWFWEDGYKKKKQKTDFVINGEIVPVSVVAARIDSLGGGRSKLEEVTLRQEGGRLFYLVSTSEKKKFLVDATTGGIASPVDSKLAQLIARQYVKGDPYIHSCTLLESYKPRKAREAKPAYEVVFLNPAHSKIYIDYNSGEILEDMDDNRKFGMWMIRLHDYDFWDSKRSISSFVGVGVFLTALSGIWIYRLRRKREA